MTKIDFYILADTELINRLSFACRLIDKIWQRGHDIYIHAPNQSTAEKFDQLLWQTRPDSFIPHSIGKENTGTNHEKVEIGYAVKPSNHHDVMINLDRDIPDFFSQFERVVEIVCQDTDILAASRKSWKFYQDRGYPLESHKIN